jgi:hypothetical protein
VNYGRRCASGRRRPRGCVHHRSSLFGRRGRGRKRWSG